MIMMEVVVGHGCVLGCCLLMCVFYEGSYSSGEALERHLHRRGMAHSRHHQMCVVCMAGEEEEQKSLQ